MLTFTNRAKKQLLAVMEDQYGEKMVVQVGITGRGPGGFEHTLDLVDESPFA